VFFLTWAAGACALANAAGPVPQEEVRRAEVVRVDRAPKLDGTLDDPLWQSAKLITDFRQREPHEGEPATGKTEVRVLYTRHAVYFGIHCFDSEPSQIIATELRRDVSQELDDHFEILIDANHNRRDAYVFPNQSPRNASRRLSRRRTERFTRCRFRFGLGRCVGFRGPDHPRRLECHHRDSLLDIEFYKVTECHLGIELQAIHSKKE